MNQNGIRTVTLDVSYMTSPKEIQAYLAETLEFPSHYGQNLDALYDCLTSITEDVVIAFLFPVVTGPLWPYLERLQQVMKDAERSNRHLLVTFPGWDV